MIEFAFQHTNELLYVILCLTSTASITFDTTKVIQTAKIYMSIVSQISHNRNTSFKKLQSIILQSCGLNDTGLTILSRLGETLHPNSLRETRIKLSVKDEENVKEMAKGLSIGIVLDNLDKCVNKVLQHQTLPLLLCREVPEEFISLDDFKKPLEEVMDSYTEDFFLLDSPCHSEEKTAFLKVIYSFTIIIFYMQCFFNFLTEMN